MNEGNKHSRSGGILNYLNDFTLKTYTQKKKKKPAIVFAYLVNNCNYNFLIVLLYSVLKAC